MRKELEGGLAWLKARMEEREMCDLKNYKEYKRKKKKWVWHGWEQLHHVIYFYNPYLTPNISHLKGFLSVYIQLYDF